MTTTRQLLAVFVWRYSAVLLCLASSSVFAQGSRQRQQQQRAQREMQKQIEEAIANRPELPTDPQLLSLHREFINKAEKLAGEYERKKQYDKAREVYEAMVRLVPKLPDAEAGVQRIMQLQSLKDRKLVTVLAADAWQDSGIILQEGMPVHIEVKGTWQVVLETGAEGVEIPEKMRPRDPRIKLGSLIGIVAKSASDLETAKPFPIRSGDDFVNKEAGRLFLRMYDLDPSDNQGKLLVLIQSTFAK
ncbi:MAG: hypothetical protein AAFX06_04230 [Planctomycetota bacterium]